MALYLPSAFGGGGKRGNPIKADELYDDFVSIYQYNKVYPDDNLKTLRITDTLIETNEILTGVERNCQLRVVLFT